MSDRRNEIEQVLSGLDPDGRAAVEGMINKTRKGYLDGVLVIIQELEKHGVPSSSSMLVALGIVFQSCLDTHIITGKALGWTPKACQELMLWRWDKWMATLEPMAPGEE